MAKLGLQLYTLRDMMEQDFTGVLKKVSDIGYQGVEFAGYGGLSATELRKVIDDLGLEGVSSHVQLHELENNLDKVLEDAQELGLSYIVCPVLPETMREGADNYRKLAGLFEQVGDKAARVGIKFAYHNHAFEFTELDGQFALDALYAWTDPKLVQAELDIYWIEYAGQSAAQYIKRYAERTELLHVKDMTNDDERFFAEVGTGQLDIPSILSAAQAAKVEWYLVEQDISRRDPLESIQISYRYLTGMGQ
ncbi:sugar phosphate isomerase/epimerase [Alicyclobacillus sp. SO9]|uniref:sugar phosphate isomerase/epimerase family protein n=1 Tax=Alicyclobacillus sp. SO9 TaxID=2665646 RepID=UPI0018E80BB8|nr:sugar phosphate isomerase/epimerase [Alicyclobacillus sp. SO9]QQE80522.1 sugar phosphate isomerase/epimerase [Alicyclobacillus sp. SO9]